MSILGELCQTFIKHDAIFERCVHALAIKWHNGVCGVADQCDFVFVIPRRAANRDQRSGRVIFEIVEQRRHEWNGIGKFFVEESANIVIGSCRGETARSFEFPEKCTGE